MALQTTTNINVDFYDKKYILINAKQNDKESRFLSVTCYDHGKLFTLSSAYHSAYIRYKKADEYSVFNSCTINKGKVIVELTEQMLAASGICYADLIIVEGGNAIVDVDTGVITGIEGSSILSTMTFCIDVAETAVDNSDIESNYDFDGLNEALDEMKANYQQVILTAKSWAKGGTGIRENEDIDNARYYYDAAKDIVAGKSVIGVKGNNEAEYRKGNVNITAYNVGAIPTTDIATTNEVKEYLGI